MAELKALMRSMRRDRISCAAVLFMLGASIAAATTTFTIADAVLWRQLPYRDATRLAAVVTRHATGPRAVSIPDFLSIRNGLAGGQIAAAGAFTPEYALTGIGDPRQLRGRVLTADYFQTLGVPLSSGRDFTRQEEKTGSGYSVIITEHLRRELFEGHDPLGSVMNLNGRPYSVVGVLPEFRDPQGDVDLYVPHQFSPTLPRRFRLMSPIIRLASTINIDQLRRKLQTFNDLVDPEAAGYSIDAIPLQEKLAAAARSATQLLFAAGSGLIGVALLNFAMLMAARLRGRQSEFALRMAIGATRGTIVRLAMMEAVTLSIGGAALGLGMAQCLLPLLREQYGKDIINQVTSGPRPIAFALLLTIVAIVVALIVSLRSQSGKVVSERNIASSRLTSGRTLVVAQIAISMALTIGSSVLARSFFELRKVDPGFRTAEMLTTRIALPVGLYGDASKRASFWRNLLQRLQDQSIAAAVTTELPLSGQDNPTSFTTRMNDGFAITTKLRSVSPNYLELIGVPLLEGRMLMQTDRAGPTMAVVVNDRLARELERLGPAIGQRVSFDVADTPLVGQVVGVVGNFRHESLSSSAAPEAYVSFEQTPLQIYSVIINSARSPSDVSGLLRTAINTIDRGQPFTPIVPMSEYVERNLSSSRLQAQVLSLFAAIALIVAASGLYALLTYLVSGARREWAVRLALGASPSDLHRAVLRQSAVYAFVGAAAGTSLFLIGGDVFQAAVYGVTIWNPILIGGCSILLILVCILSAMVPALHASRISPIEAIRN